MTNANWPSFELARPANGRPLPEGWQAPSRGALDNFARSRALGMAPVHALGLRQPAMRIPLDEIDCSRTRKVVERLRRAAALEREAGRKLVGLAANQLEWSGQIGAIALVDLGTQEPNTNLTELTAVVNPILIPDQGCTMDEGPEGCFSCGPVFSRPRRPTSGLLVAHTDKGEFLSMHCTGYTPRVIGHETDHLEGKLAPDVAYAQGAPVDWRHPELKDQYRACIETGAEWPYPCPVEQWRAMNAGIYRLEDFVVGK